MHYEPLSLYKTTLIFGNGTVQWSAWLTYTRLHPPTIKVHLFPFQKCSCSKLLEGITSRRNASTMYASQHDFNRNKGSGRRRGKNEDKARRRTKRQNDCADDSINAAASDICEEKIGLWDKVNEVGSPGKLNSGVLVQANGTKIRPPAFLTPAKSQTTTPISSSVSTAPPDVSTPSTFEREDNAGGRRPKRDH